MRYWLSRRHRIILKQRPMAITLINAQIERFDGLTIFEAVLLANEPANRVRETLY